MYLVQIVRRHLACVISTIALLLIMFTPLKGYSLVIDSFSSGIPDVINDFDQSWTANSLSGYSIRIASGTCDGHESVIYRNTSTTLSVALACSPLVGDQYEIHNTGMADGNSLVSSNSVQGVEPTWPSQPVPPNWDDSAGIDTAEAITSQYSPITSWNPTNSPQTEGAFCIRCHSAYSYGASPRNTTSGSPTSTSGSWDDVIGPAVPEGDAANEFNPNNLGYHPVFAPGMNQPVADSNPNWPVLTGGDLSINSGTAFLSGGVTLPITVLPGWKLSTPDGWRKVTSIISNTEFTVYPALPNIGSTTEWKLTAGLGNNFVPPWGPWSTMRCTDCHVTSSLTNDMTPHFDSYSKYHLKLPITRELLYWDGTSISPINLTPESSNTLCINCHRKDVYGDFTRQGYLENYGSLSKHQHGNMIWGSNTYNTLPKWGIVCMNCHGGERIGSIHGSNLGFGGNGAGGSWSGERLLSGAALYSVTRGTASTNALIWYKNYPSDAVDNIHQGWVGLETASPDNYDYVSDTDFFPVSTPTQITVPSSSSTGSFQVSWTASVTQAARYVLEQSSDGGNNWSAVSTYTDDTLTYADISGLAEGTYQYRVKAVKAGQTDSDWTTSSTVSVGLQASTPQKIFVPSSSSSGNIQVSWFESTTPGATYGLEQSSDGGNNWAPVASYTNDALSYANIYGLTSGSYLYRVKAVATGYIDSAWKTSATVTVTLQVSAPRGIYLYPAASTTGTTQVSWGTSTTSGANYVLEERYSSDGGNNWSAYAAVAQYTDPALAYANVSGLVDGLYQYRVKAYKSEYSDSTWVASSNLTVALATEAKAPRKIFVPSTSSSGNIEVSWFESKTSGATYALEESSDGGNNWAPVPEYTDNTLAYTNIFGLSEGSHLFRVNAIATGLNSSPWTTSSPVNVVLATEAPKKIFVTNPKNNVAQVSWFESETVGATYALEQSTDGGNNWGAVAEYTDDTLEYANVILGTGTYVFRVKAVKTGSADSGWKISKSVTN